MTAQTIWTTNGVVSAAPARPARLRRWLDWFCNLSVQIELDPHLAEDIGQKSYDVTLLPRRWTEASPRAARRQSPREIERCERSCEAPILEASWSQAISEAIRRPGRPAGHKIATTESHTVRDVGIELDNFGFRHVQVGSDRYV